VPHNGQKHVVITPVKHAAAAAAAAAAAVPTAVAAACLRRRCVVAEVPAASQHYAMCDGSLNNVDKGQRTQDAEWTGRG
jgi:hypothetical protein